MLQFLANIPEVPPKQEVVKIEKMVQNTFLSIYGQFLLCFSYSIKIKTQQPSTKRSYLLNDGLL